VAHTNRCQATSTNIQGYDSQQCMARFYKVDVFTTDKYHIISEFINSLYCWFLETNTHPQSGLGLSHQHIVELCIGHPRSVLMWRW